MAGGWFNCQVVQAGSADDGKMYIGLQDTANPPSWTPWRWYFAIDVVKNEMLATALAAISTGCRVSVDLVDIVQYSQINRLYIIAA
jgi:hypothetical protein